MKEKPKRLAPTSETLREIFLKSGNLCAFPDCGRPNMTSEGLFTAQVCHIEAAEPGGERFNANMTNEGRRQAANLMIMCYEHHVETNDESRFSPATMKQMKADHENRFADPERAMQENLHDKTAHAAATLPLNLGLYEKMVGGLTDVHRAECLGDLTAFVATFRMVPVVTRKFLSAVVTRMNLMRHTDVVDTVLDGPRAILLQDLIHAFNLSEEGMHERVKALVSYKLAWIEHRDTEHGEQIWLRIEPISDGWKWPELYDFCKYIKASVDVFAVNMDFARLDTPS